MTLYDTKLHKIYLIPLEVAGAILNYFTDPLVYVRSFGGNLSARNRDLNPIGLKRNLRQHFGSNSNKVTLDCYISPLEDKNVNLGIDLINKAVNTTTLKWQYLKTAIHEQTQFLLLYNNDFEVVSLDVLDYRENATKPYIYDITLQATSLRVYDGLPYFLGELSQNVLMNGIAQNLLPTLVM